ncbi:MAG: excinuclease ABC subunit A, partial [Bdellovibrionales bacterium]|nr:excinuclease ABC subunit A [Bdellovibrionales bacterium]
GVNEARQRGYTPGTFSLNVEGGRCPVCKGLGHETIDMMFMDDIEIPCEACDGKRFRPEILEIKYHKKTIHDVLNMTVSQAMDFFVSYPNIRRPLSILREVGLEYLTLGQTAKSLSGGESQRLKVAKELNNTNQRATLYIMDEPTTGLHFREVHLLLNVLNKLVDNGSSVLLIEHNLEIIKNSDYIIDIGPEAGEAGGKIIAQGSPEELMKSKRSLTAKYLKQYIEETNPQKRH